MDRKVIDLAEPFPSRYVHQNPSGGGRYVTHSVVTQRLIAVLGAPPDFHLVEVIRGDVPAIIADPDGKSQRAKEGRPALTNAIVGAVCRMTAFTDSTIRVEEAGDCEDPHNWPHDGARLKDAMSDAYKRCAMRLGCGLHLWLKDSDDYFLHDMLRSQNVGAASTPGSREPGAHSGTPVSDNPGDTRGPQDADAPPAYTAAAPTTSQEHDMAVDPPASPGKPGDDAVALEPPSGVTAPPGDSYPPPCPKCGSQARQQYELKPDANPTKQRHRCHDCGFDSGWTSVPTTEDGGGSKDAEGEAASRPAATTTERATKEQLDRLAVSYGGQAKAIRAAWAMFELTSRELPSIATLSFDQAERLILEAVTS